VVSKALPQYDFKESIMQENTGGRLNFPIGSQVRILDETGRVSDEVYDIVTEKSDRKGHTMVALGQRQLKVHSRRILPIDTIGHAVVVESAGRYRAVCPNCQHLGEYDSETDQITCPDHGQAPLYWLSTKPMRINKVGKVAVKKPAVKKRVITQEGVKVKQPIVINLDELSKLADCELFTQSNIPFDHARVVVKSHTLICKNGRARKLCFNTYNGTLGKKSKDLPIAEFLADQGDEKKWFYISDLDKEKASLAKKGYELHS